MKLFAFLFPILQHDLDPQQLSIKRDVQKVHVSLSLLRQLAVKPVCFAQ